MFKGVTHLACKSFGQDSLVGGVSYLYGTLAPHEEDAKVMYIFPLDSVMSNCVSKYTRSTYGLHSNRGLNTFCTNLLIRGVGRNVLSELRPLFVLCVWSSDIMTEFDDRGSPHASLSLRYASRCRVADLVVT